MIRIVFSIFFQRGKFVFTISLIIIVFIFVGSKCPTQESRLLTPQDSIYITKQQRASNITKQQQPPQQQHQAKPQPQQNVQNAKPLPPPKPS